MRRIVALALAWALLVSAPAYAESVTAPGIPRVYGEITNTALTTSITGGGVVEQFDTQVAGNVGGNICDVTTNKGRCTPTVAGTYLVICKADGTATTGPAVNLGLLTGWLAKNGTEITGTEAATAWAQVAAISSVRASTQTSGLVTVNGTADYWECYENSGATGMVQNANATRNSMFYSYVGP